ncbi:MAG: hypothetical protein IJH07_04765 [Ruminococcus sp.]|nr:hypothetical protein [Ruminococcus sp.]
MKNAMIQKTASVGALSVSEAELEKVNEYSLEQLKAEDVYLFKIAVCSNAQNTDRDNEPLLRKAVEGLAERLKGRTILFDHNASAKNQVARIYDTELIGSDAQTAAGEPLITMAARCYMVKTESNADLIAEIKAGIKKEVSVGFSTSGRRCSICGKQFYTCAHHKGRTYDGKICRAQIEDCIDAYEVSFVAVPCQVDAGTTKSADVEQTAEKEDELLAKARIRINEYFFKEAETA